MRLIGTIIGSTQGQLYFTLTTTSLKHEALSAPVFSVQNPYIHRMFGRFLERLADCASCDWQTDVIVSIGGSKKQLCHSSADEPQPCFMFGGASADRIPTESITRAARIHQLRRPAQAHVEQQLRAVSINSSSPPSHRGHIVNLINPPPPISRLPPAQASRG